MTPAADPHSDVAPDGNGRSARRALVLLLILLGVFFAPVLLLGEVVYPHNNSLTVQMPFPQEPGRILNEKLADVGRQYVPELHHHLHGERRSWISTWNPHVQLGRPTAQVVGVSRAYPPTLLLSWLSGDAFRLYSLLAVATVAGIALFFFLFLAELGLRPAACFAGAAGLALGTYCCYWLSFVTFLSTLCWTAALLWLVTRYLRRPGPGAWLGIAFAFYALLLSGYPQQIVHQAYLLAGVTLVRLARGRAPGFGALRATAGLAAALALGALASAPVYLDLLETASQSARLEVPEEFFLQAIPPPKTARGIRFFLGVLFDAFWFGNPIDPACPLQYGGVSLGPVFASLVPLAFLPGQLRRTWPWLGAAAIAFWLALSRPAFLVAVRHLGFDLSRSNPMVTALIPTLVACAIVVDGVLDERRRPPRVAALLALLPLGVALWAFLTHREPVQVRVAVLSATLVLFSAAFLALRRPTLLLGAVVVASFAYGGRLVLRRPPGDVHRTSPLVEALREETGGRVRYAFLRDWPLRLLNPNVESLLDLRSVHSYDSLSSQRFQDLTLRLGPRGTQIHGRIYDRILDDSRLAEADFGFSGVGILVSAQEMDPDVALPIRRVGRVVLFRTLREPIQELQVMRYRRLGPGAVEVPGALQDHPPLRPVRREDQDDRLVLETRALQQESVLFLSQQYHPRWRARGDAGELRTVEVNGFYLGVALPAGTQRVTLEFRPHVLWAWLPQALFGAGALALALRRRARRSRTP